LFGLDFFVIGDAPYGKQARVSMSIPVIHAAGTIDRPIELVPCLMCECVLRRRERG
jgi:hypothetical protein